MAVMICQDGLMSELRTGDMVRKNLFIFCTELKKKKLKKALTLYTQFLQGGDIFLTLPNVFEQ